MVINTHRLLLLAGTYVWLACSGKATESSTEAPSTDTEPPTFERVVIDPQGKGRTAIGDINNDGQNDIVVHTWGSERGKVDDGSLVWYQYPDWNKQVIHENAHYFGDAVVIADINEDGWNDIVTSKGDDGKAEAWWYRNPGEGTGEWEEYMIGLAETGSEMKDIEVHDIDEDGKPDVVARTKHYFTVYFQTDSLTWLPHPMDMREREGMAMNDVDGDGDYDAIMNGFWVENPANPRDTEWPIHVIDELWYTDSTGGWQDFSVSAAVADINGDGNDDIVFGHPEKTGFSLTWYEAENPTEGPWTKHEVAVVDYCHTVQTGDMDNDGDTDIVAGTLSRTDTPALFVFYNASGQGLEWERMKVDDQPVYKASIGDIGNDGDIDVVSSFNWDTAPLSLWKNTLND